jgi:hypothetical protein
MRFAIFFLEIYGVPREAFGMMGIWERVGRSYASENEASLYVQEIAGAKSRWVVQPVWGEA